VYNDGIWIVHDDLLQARGNTAMLISYVYCKFVIYQYPVGPYIKLKGFHHRYLLNDVFFLKQSKHWTHSLAHTSGRKHCESISFLILKCPFVSFDVDKIKVKFKWFMTCDVWISWRNHDFCNLYLWMTYSNRLWWLRYRTLTCPYITSLPKEIQHCFQFDSFSYGPAVHLIS